MRAIPTIRTARLTLRAMRLQDFERFAEIWRDPSVVAHLGGVPWDEPRAWASFLRNAGHWQMVGYGQWAIEPHGTREMVGQVGFFVDRTDEAASPWPEAGWMLHPDAQGQGLGIDAVQAAHDWFDRVITGPLTCRILPGNDRSDAIARQLGYHLADPETEDDGALQLYLRKTPPGGPRNLLDDCSTRGSM
ncbi:N-acetyltransferase [Aliishimia ponticola]|uniref:N-acetyltransferase n=1 Tax=Aliishimia ponticola TaxID=2499833 RepID=A0A4S4NFI2_9RHOB|nr:GNAT family N-acetyltransferase [Aliishimia ponticola]THH38299.1 N-acetyltransferase [Aliishimia ponticola]